VEAGVGVGAGVGIGVGIGVATGAAVDVTADAPVTAPEVVTPVSCPAIAVSAAAGPVTAARSTDTVSTTAADWTQVWGSTAIVALSPIARDITSEPKSMVKLQREKKVRVRSDLFIAD